MHTYAIGGTKSNIRIKVIIFLFVISVIISTLMNVGIDKLAEIFPDIFEKVNNFLNTWSFFDFSIGNISVFLIYGILMWIFDKKIWRQKFVNHFLGIPDFSGTWNGELVSSFDSNNKIGVKMTITQTWTDIHILSCFTDTDSGFQSSESGSDSAFINPDYQLGSLLKFTYINIAQDVDYEQSEHRGQNEMLLKNFDKKKNKYMTLEGIYFNNRGKTGNKGTMIMNRIS